MSGATLYRWPESARFERSIPKSKFYEQGNVSPAVRQKFVSEVQKISWAYKLAESTVNLAGNDEVPEIQVFEIEAKGDDVDVAVLSAIDRSIPYPIVFEIAAKANGTPKVKLVACHKQLRTGKPKLSEYFAEPWTDSDQTRTPLPAAIDLPALYASLLSPMLPSSARSGETVADSAERMAEIAKREREVAKLERKLRNEPQFNRKVEVRRELKEREAALQRLTKTTIDSEEQDVKDQRWTS